MTAATGTISVGQLRRNPTQMLRDVRSGAVYTITDHGEPVAEVARVRGPRWISSEEFNELKREIGADKEWAREIAENRAAEYAPDPWERTR